MIIDALLQWDAGINLAQVVGTYSSTNVIDLAGPALPSSVAGGNLGVPGRDLSIGDDPAMKMYVTVLTTFTSGGAGTLQVKMQGAPDSGVGTPGAYFDMVLTPVFALATLVQGAIMMDGDMPGVPPGQPLPRFLRLQYIIAGATMTAGVVQAELVLDRFDQIQSSTGALSGYPAGITIAN